MQVPSYCDALLGRDSSGRMICTENVVPAFLGFLAVGVLLGYAGWVLLSALGTLFWLGWLLLFGGMAGAAIGVGLLLRHQQVIWNPDHRTVTARRGSWLWRHEHSYSYDQVRIVIDRQAHYVNLCYGFVKRPQLSIVLPDCLIVVMVTNSPAKLEEAARNLEQETGVSRCVFDKPVISWVCSPSRVYERICQLVGGPLKS